MSEWNPEIIEGGLGAVQGPKGSVPQQRIREKVDDYMSRRDYDGVERHLKYWLEEAKMIDDLRGQLMIRNEMVGHYRKVGNKEGAFESAADAIRLLDELDYGGSISVGTTYVNIATAYNAFQANEESLEMFEKAREVYESIEGTPPELLGGLYNNMALTCAALGKYDEAEALYDKAMDRMAYAPNGVLEQAITCLNRANVVEMRDGLEGGEARINELIEEAQELLDTPSVPRDGYYAFVCEKCAPSFEYYGYFLVAEDLKERSKKIYERS
ncbi:MAG: tetratricopeptide repeat protein [Firmicutes bacterium]|nr:tetratricopeptide repeat protein [Bacillota bacterium]